MTGGYLLRRIAYLAINLWVIVTLVFLLFRLLPGDPSSLLVNPLAGPEQQEAIRDRLGLDEPLAVQYVVYLKNVLQGEFGDSFFGGRPVAETVLPAALNTAILATGVLVVSYLVGCAVGSYLAWRRGSRVERFGGTMVFFIRGMPTFWVGMLAISVFAVRLGWFPTSGIRTGDYSGSLLSVYLSPSFLQHLALPVLATSVYAVGLPLLLMRGSMLDTLGADYMELARAKGLTERALLFKHSMRNALMPLVASASEFIGWAMGGLVAVEVVFSWPGLGREIVTAVSRRDYPVLQGSFIVIAILVMVLYLIADLTATFLDPRAGES